MVIYINYNVSPILVVYMYIFVGFFCLFRYFGMLLLSVSTMIITFPVRGSLQWVGEHPNIHISLIIMIACDIDIIWYLLCWSDDLQCIEFHCLEALPSPLMLLRRGDASLKNGNESHGHGRQGQLKRLWRSLSTPMVRTCCLMLCVFSKFAVFLSCVHNLKLRKLHS